MASESPTSTMSTPARSAASPEGKSCAVTMAMGVLEACRLRSVFIVTFLRRGGSAAGSMGACEDRRHCVSRNGGRDAVAVLAVSVVDVNAVVGWSSCRRWRW